MAGLASGGEHANIRNLKEGKTPLIPLSIGMYFAVVEVFFELAETFAQTGAIEDGVDVGFDVAHVCFIAYHHMPGHETLIRASLRVPIMSTA